MVLLVEEEGRVEQMRPVQLEVFMVVEEEETTTDQVRDLGRMEVSQFDMSLRSGDHVPVEPSLLMELTRFILSLRAEPSLRWLLPDL
jgi:hypothetical protein